MEMRRGSKFKLAVQLGLSSLLWVAMTGGKSSTAPNKEITDLVLDVPKMNRLLQLLSQPTAERCSEGDSTSLSSSGSDLVSREESSLEVNSEINNEATVLMYSQTLELLKKIMTSSRYQNILDKLVQEGVGDSSKNKAISFMRRGLDTESAAWDAEGASGEQKTKAWVGAYRNTTDFDILAYSLSGEKTGPRRGLFKEYTDFADFVLRKKSKEVPSDPHVKMTLALTDVFGSLVENKGLYYRLEELHKAHLGQPKDPSEEEIEELLTKTFKKTSRVLLDRLDRLQGFLQGTKEVESELKSVISDLREQISVKD